MVIEKATNLKFQLPPYITGNDLLNIDIVYNAIKERSFAWPIQTLQVTVPANQYVFKLLPHDTPHDFLLSNDLVEKTILNNTVFLGHEALLIKDAVTINFSEVQEKMQSNDNHLMRVNILSLKGQGIYTYSDAPKISNKPWTPIISKLIELEQTLNNALANEYHKLAAATLANLTEQEQTEITSNSLFTEPS
ncbi:MAG: hypothetical protein HY819_07185 [Acidobacteria bacterium]|nr:hypothetical protein [Acidobacteriota bacterium]